MNLLLTASAIESRTAGELAREYLSNLISKRLNWLSAMMDREGSLHNMGIEIMSRLLAVRLSAGCCPCSGRCFSLPPVRLATAAQPPISILKAFCR